MVKFEKQQVVPVYQQIEEHLRKLIRKEDIEISERLPSEEQLARQCRVSRMTMRKAINALVAEGLLERRRGKGTFVGDWKNSQKRVRCFAVFNSIVEPYPTDAYSLTVYDSLLAVSRRYRCKFLFVAPGHDPATQGRETLEKDTRIDGLIWVSPKIHSDFGYLSTLRIPSIVFGCTPGADEVNAINSDDLQGSTKAVEYLARLGHTRIGFVARALHTPANTARLEGYKKVLANGDVKGGRARVYEGPDAVAKVVRALRGRRKTSCTALLATSQGLALELMGAIKAAGRRVPEDVSVIGYDDSEILGYLQTPLTVVKQPLQEMARLAVKTLVDLSSGKGKAPVRLCFEQELVIRRSCARARRMSRRGK